MLSNKRRKPSSTFPPSDASRPAVYEPNIGVGSVVVHIREKFHDVVVCRVNNVIVLREQKHSPFSSLVDEDGSPIFSLTSDTCEIPPSELREEFFAIRMFYVITAVVDNVPAETKIQMQQDCIAIMKETYSNQSLASQEKLMQIEKLEDALTKKLQMSRRCPLTPTEFGNVFDTIFKMLRMGPTDGTVAKPTLELEEEEEEEDEVAFMQPQTNLYRTILPFNYVGSDQLAEHPDPVRNVFTYLTNAGKLVDCRFNLLETLLQIHSHLSQPPAAVAPRMMGGGRTQSGKTFLKVVTALLAHVMDFTTVVITPGSVNVSALCRTIQGHLVEISEGLPENTVPHCFELSAKGKDKAGTPLKGTLKRDTVDKTLRDGGVIVVNYTYTMLDQVLDRTDISNARRIVLILDEADELYKAGINKQEQKLAQFEENRTGLIFDVTATLLPVLLRGVITAGLVYHQKDVVTLVPETDYNSTEDLRRLTRFGSEVRLDLVHLTWRNQYLDEELLKLYDDVMQHPNVGERRALVVDISNPRVSAEGGLSDKAGVLMLHYKDVEIKFLLVTGSFMCHTHFDRTAGSYVKWMYFDKSVKLQDALAEMEVKWNGPIVVLGYSQLIRGVSVRTSVRVPTHVAVGLTKGLSREKLVQAMGRGTGNFKEQLKINDYQFTTILCSDEDYDTVMCYPKVIETFTTKLAESGKVRFSLEVALVDFVKPGARPVGYAKTEWLAKIVEFCPSACLIPDTDFSKMKRADLATFCKNYYVQFFGTESIADLIESINANKRKREEHFDMILKSSQLEQAVAPSNRGTSALDGFIPRDLRIADMVIEADGNCFFRAFAQRYLRDQERHGEVRQLAITYARHDLPEWLMTAEMLEKGKMNVWFESMLQLGTWADELAIRATAEYYHVQIVLYCDFASIRYPDTNDGLPVVALGFLSTQMQYVVLESNGETVACREEEEEEEGFSTRVAMQEDFNTPEEDTGLGDFQEAREMQLVIDLTKV
ncbi:hypothetical protein BASA81_001176 [Batrachochytrium salamandrivorans]|nr:hypothetical protein BASA81_001176 [Batrachochytrium salamandrivorans]